ncbi:ATP-binding protein (plasmid) [Hymenobacter tibetensis]|uniref:histidine kinase n=1 Tax=Hymenobacter tibetensis TaxID=497967 RepID=A0ABY4D4X1_9BACT|nr:hybrid sensor histidine kinase/response regulator transcription factor [Hymenobacter tibetensis]UOG77556.1 ATP-binding protein [Hymenobacter tibetensis]
MGNSASAQTHDIKVTALTTKDGLASNTVNAILKDRYGLLWLATDGGLKKYDGQGFTTYQLKSSGMAGFQANDISALHEDHAGRLWVGTMGGALFTYNRAQDAFTPYLASNQATPLNNNYVKSLCSDASGNVWVATMTGVEILNPQTAKTTRLALAPPTQSKTLNPICVYADRKHRVWMGTESGLFCYNPVSKAIQSFKRNPANARSLVGDTVNAIVEDQYGQLWIGTNNGLSQLTADEVNFNNFRFNYANQRTIGSNYIYTIAADRDGTIWLGTEGGLDILDVKSGMVTRHVHNSRDPYSLNSKSVRSLFIDRQGIHWIGTYQGGLSKYDQNLTLFNVERSSELDPFGLNAPAVTAFAENRNGDIFVGTDGGGLNVYNLKTRLFRHIEMKSRERINLAGLPILTMLLDRHDQLWIGTFGHGLFIYNTRTGGYEQLLAKPGSSQLNSNDIFCLEEDHNGTIWIGTNGGGVNVYDPNTKRITKFTARPKTAEDKLLPVNNYIRAIEEDSNGNIWIGSAGSGIAVYHPVDEQFTIYNAARTGLALDRVNTFGRDHHGVMWIGTTGDGLFQFDTRSSKLTAFPKQKGLPDGFVHKIVEDGEGNLWISTNQGISRLDTKQNKFTHYSSDNGLQGKAFLNNSGFRSSNGSLFFGGIAGFNYLNPSLIKVNRNVPRVILTDLKVDNKSVVAGDHSPLRQSIAIAKEIDLDYKQNFSINYTALDYTLPQQNQYAYKLKGFDQAWNYVGPTTTAYYTNLDPGEYEFQVKASNNDGIWNQAGTSIKIIIHPPFWKTIYAYGLYLALIGCTLLYSRYRGIKQLKKEFEQQQERKQAERVRELDLLKIKFLTNLSHEFRTPISLILAPTNKLLAQQKDPQSAGQLQVIQRNARRLLHLVNQLLDFRKLEEHELQLNLSQGEISSFVREITNSFQDLAEIKKIKLSLGLPTEQLFVLFDYDKVERILVNLLSNAFKFTPEGGTVSVELSTLPAPPETPEKTIRIQVVDTGIGISPSEQGLIFERFFQGHELGSVLHQSSGIGLSITKEFAELHGGTIGVVSELGHGTTFTVELPLAAFTPVAERESTLPAEVPEMVEENKKPSRPTKKLKAGELPHLLLVEDDDDFRYYLKDNLKDNYRITDVLNGKDGWYKALSCHPDLIVSDITMPYMDGVALSRKLKSDKRTNHIPIILLTGLTQEEEQLRGLESGANDYLTKPFNFEILHARIKNLLELNRALKTTYTKQLQVVPSPVEIESSSEKFLNNVVLYIEKNLKNVNFSVEDLSDHFGMSRGSMYNKILELTGMPPVEFIRSLKLDRAAVLLQESDLTISEVAYRAGFATPHYFTKSFKTKFSILPSDYRKSKKQELKD